MKNFHRILIHILILLLLLALALTPPLLAGVLDLRQADALRDSSPAQAALKYESAAQHLPWQTDLWEKAGLAALTGGNPDLAVQLLKRAPGLSATGRLALGDALFRAGNKPAALEQWERLRADGLGSAWWRDAAHRAAAFARPAP